MTIILYCIIFYIRVILFCVGWTMSFLLIVLVPCIYIPWVKCIFMYASKTKCDNYHLYCTIIIIIIKWCLHLVHLVEFLMTNCTWHLVQNIIHIVRSCPKCSSDTENSKCFTFLLSKTWHSKLVGFKLHRGCNAWLVATHQWHYSSNKVEGNRCKQQILLCNQTQTIMELTWAQLAPKSWLPQQIKGHYLTLDYPPTTPEHCFYCMLSITMHTQVNPQVQSAWHPNSLIVWSESACTKLHELSASTPKTSPNQKAAQTNGQLTILYHDTPQALLDSLLRYASSQWLANVNVDDTNSEHSAAHCVPPVVSHFNLVHLSQSRQALAY